jgi:hypothetical protein
MRQGRDQLQAEFASHRSRWDVREEAVGLVKARTYARHLVRQHPCGKTLIFKDGHRNRCLSLPDLCYTLRQGIKKNGIVLSY